MCFFLSILQSFSHFESLFSVISLLSAKAFSPLIGLCDQIHPTQEIQDNLPTLKSVILQCIHALLCYVHNVKCVLLKYHSEQFHFCPSLMYPSSYPLEPFRTMSVALMFQDVTEPFFKLASFSQQYLLFSYSLFFLA